MLLDPRDGSLAFRSDEVIADLPPDLRDRVTPETHAAVMEVTTGVHRRVPDAVAELAELRRRMSRALAGQGLRAAVAGMHPSATWSETVVSSHPRYRHVGESMRVLARREPTLATHVHVGVATPRAAVRLLNRLRVHLPLLLALSANSPFWQGRATGFASTRTTLFDAFPRTGLPRSFHGYSDWVRTVDALRPVGRDRRSLAPMVGRPPAAAARHRRGPHHGCADDGRRRGRPRGARPVARAVRAPAPRPPREELPATELIAENRFLAARDGMEALFIDGDCGQRIPAIAQLERILAACHRHAKRLGCERELAALRALAATSGASRQLAHARDSDLRPVTASLAHAYSPDLPIVDHPHQAARRAA